MDGRNGSISGALAGFAVILLLECLLTLFLGRSPGVIRSAPGAIYLYLLVIALAAIAWTWIHALFAIVLALILQDFWLFAPAGELSMSSRQELHLAVFGCVAVVLAIVESFMTEARRRLKMECEIHGSVTRTLQRALLPQMNDVPGYDLAFLYEPASRDTNVGGDFLDVFRLNENEVGLLIGDVTGHGVEVAVQTVQIRHMLEMCALQGHTPAECLAAVNRMVCADGRFPDMVTLFYAVLDTRCHTLTYAGAGHVPPLLWRDDPGVVETLNPGGLILGACPGDLHDYRNAILTLEPGDVLLLYTDGVTEARRGHELFGEDRLGVSLWSLARKPAAFAVPELYNDVRDFAGAELRDDAAIVWLRRPWEVRA